MLRDARGEVYGTSLSLFIQDRAHGQTGQLSIYIFPDSEKVITDFLAARHLFPTQSWDVDNTHHTWAAPAGLRREVASQLVFVDVLVPIVCALGHNAQQVLGQQVRRDPAGPRPRYGAEDQPAARPHKLAAPLQEGGWVVDVLDDLEHRDDVEGVFR